MWYMKIRIVLSAATAALSLLAARAGGIDFQKLIDEAAAKGGGRVVVPAGVHETKSLRLRSHVELHLEKGAVLRGSVRHEDYFDFPTDLLDDASDGRGDSDNHYAKDFSAAVAANPTKVKKVITPKQWDVYNLGGASMKVINNAYFGAGNNFANDSSVMYKFISGNQNVLFTGDMGEYSTTLFQDKNVLAECQDCQIVQLAHHGQRGMPTTVYDKLPNIEVCLVPAVWWLFNNDGGTGTNTATLDSFTIRSYFRDRGISHLYSQTNGDVTIR